MGNTWFSLVISSTSWTSGEGLYRWTSMLSFRKEANSPKRPLGISLTPVKSKARTSQLCFSNRAMISALSDP